jgi:predicted HD superfamily hydrolase involved in NAD metabolism
VAAQIEARLRQAVDELPSGLREHVLRVEAEAASLALRHRQDEERARLAALGHDLVRHIKGAQLLGLASQYGLAPDPVEQASPVLVHGPVAARILRRDYAYDDAEVLAGIDCHTTARSGMSALEKVLFIADKVEPGKLVHEAALGEVKDLAEESLDAAVLRYLDHILEQAVRRRWLVHPRSLEARNELLRVLERVS